MKNYLLFVDYSMIITLSSTTRERGAKLCTMSLLLRDGSLCTLESHFEMLSNRSEEAENYKAYGFCYGEISKNIYNGHRALLSPSVCTIALTAVVSLKISNGFWVLTELNNCPLLIHLSYWYVHMLTISVWHLLLKIYMNFLAVMT